MWLWFQERNLNISRTFVFQKQPPEVFYNERRNPVFCKKGFLRNCIKFTGKHLCQSLFFNKVAGRPATLLKRRLWHRYFLVNFVQFLRNPFLQNTSGRLLLIFVFHHNIYYDEAKLKQIKLWWKIRIAQDSHQRIKLHIVGQFLQYNENKILTFMLPLL